MNIYLDSGYLNIASIINLNTPFIFIISGRGLGKTYGALKYEVEEQRKFMFMRRTQSQLDIINKPELSPFKILNTDMGWNIGTAPLSKYNAGFYHMEKNGDGIYKPAGAPIGYTSALSTISNLRGFDASDVTEIVYDEFIPERHERPIKNEGAALLNAYETMNRNRELKGQPPIKLLALANSNDLGNPIFMELGLIAVAERMRRNAQEVYINSERGIAIIMPTKSPISELKKNTALYKLARGSEFEEMSINNDFEELKSKSVKTRPLAEYKPLVSIGEITIYKHKSNGGLYVSTHRTGSPETYGTSDIERARFRRAFSWVWYAYMEDRIIFENSTSEIILEKYFN